MKFTINIEASPEEARAFLGLPDVKPLQDKMMKELEEKMTQNLREMDAETLMKTWMPPFNQAVTEQMAQGWGEFSKAFWGQMGAAGTGKKED